VCKELLGVLECVEECVGWGWGWDSDAVVGVSVIRKFTFPYIHIFL